MAMSTEHLGLVLLGALLVGIFLGFPIAFTLIALAGIFGYIGLGPIVFDILFFQTLGTMQEEVLAAVPLFVFMGYILERSGLVERLFRGLQLTMGPVRGSLYLATLLTATVFATATGIIGASVTVIGVMAIPAMMRSKYSPVMAAGTVTAGGTLGILIPPSVLLVLYGPVAGVSVAKLYAAAVGPGLLLSALYIGYTMIRSFLQPQLGPPLPLEERATSYRQALRELLIGVVPAAVLIFAALGSIIAGAATPTEAAALGAGGALALTFLYRRLSWATLKQATLSTLQTSSLILLLVVASNFYGAVFARLGTATWITQGLLSMALPPAAMLWLIMLIIYILGWPLEWPAIILIFVPFFLPVVDQMGIDPLWFGILVAVNLQTAFLSPPVAMAAYYLKAVAPEMQLWDIYKGMLQFMVLQLAGLAIVFFFPEIALWLPRVLFD
jgi:tripartite ATP-independent transporter DctM subunit